MDINQEKRKLRKEVKRLKGEYSLAQKKEMSIEILRQIEMNSNFRKASVIMAYWSMDDEVFTHEFVEKWANEKHIILPVVNEDELHLKEFKGQKKMIAGDRYGIPEPDGQEFENPELIELIIVPGVAFDKENNRMGRGKAYYDKLLRNTDAYKLGICFHFQLFDHVPHDDLDVKMEEVIYS